MATNDPVMIFLRGNQAEVRDIAWTLLESEPILSADSLTRYEVYLKGGDKRKMGSNSSMAILMTRQDLLDPAMARIGEFARQAEVSAYAVPVLAAVNYP